MSTRERMPQITLAAICWGPHCLQRETGSCHSFLSVQEWGKHEGMADAWKALAGEGAKYSLEGLSILFHSGTTKSSNHSSNQEHISIKTTEV